jgi:hypothetical protein
MNKTNKNEVVQWMHKHPKTTTNVGLAVSTLAVAAFIPTIVFWLAVGGISGGYAFSDKFHNGVKKQYLGLVGKVRNWTR